MQKFQVFGKKSFSFLETEFGFKCHLLADGILRYETEDVFVLVGYDGRRSYELTLDLGQKGTSTERAFNFGEVLRSAKAPENIASSYQVNSEESLKTFLQTLAQALQSYGVDFLRNDASAFTRLAQLRGREGKEYALERGLRNARREADIAWRKKNYEAVVKSLKPFRAALTAAEVGKLEFAETKLG